MFFVKKRKWRKPREPYSGLLRKALCSILILELAYGVEFFSQDPLFAVHKASNIEKLQNSKPEFRKIYGITFELKEGKLIFYRKEESVEATDHQKTD